ncbi:MAG: histidine kinase, partial [Bacteroidota bacterium]
MKFTFNTVLPIALSLTLPGLGSYTNADFMAKTGLAFWVTWLTTSIFLYIMWHCLWYLGEAKKDKNKRLIAINLGVLIVIFFWSLFLFAPEYVEALNLLSLARLSLVIILFLSIQYALRTQRNIAQLLIEKEQIQKENYRVQLKALQAKIDPHFLFNSLNTLRSMVRQRHVNAEEFIISLSDFYRQNLKQNENATLPLSEELMVLQSYLFLMKSRNEEAVSIKLNIDHSLYSFHLPTLALQIVVENCFKHNSMTSKMPLQIEITNTDDFYIVVTNNLQPKIGQREPSGYGLDLLRKRY